MKKLDNKSKKIITTTLAISMLASATGMVVYAKTNDGKIVDNTTNNIIETKGSKENNSNLISVKKDETVYVLANSDGSAKKVIVSDWLKTFGKKGQINDKSELENIENVKGEESYSMNPDNMKVWNSEGKDIYYQGTTNKELPVSIHIKYKLDGKDISADDLVGKSGKVTIHFDYVNNQNAIVNINGKEETIYVPFMMLTGTVLDNDKFTNIKVTNGNVVNDGNKSIVMGYSLPGLQESLNLSKDKIDIPSSLEITADVKDFSLTTTMTVATNDVFNNLNLDNVSDLESLSKSLNKLTDSAKKLVDGSSELYDGMNKLSNKSGILVEGINKLNDGADAVNKGANSLNDGSKELKDGVSKLNNGLNELANNNEKLNNGAKQIFDSLLSKANEELKKSGLEVPELTIENYDGVLNNVISNLDKDKVHQMAYNTALEKVKEAVKGQEGEIRNIVISKVRDTVLEGVLEAIGKPMKAEEYKKAVEAGIIPIEQQEQINAAVEDKMATDEIKSLIDKKVEEQIEDIIKQKMESDEVKSQIRAAEEKAAAGNSSIQMLKGQLDNYKEFYNGLKQYTNGVETAKEGSNQLKIGVNKLGDGTKNLADGTTKLKTGIGDLKTGSRALVDGVNKLTNGSKTLKEGMNQFNEEGIKKLVSAYGDLDSLVERMNLILDVSKKYNNFSGISKDSEGSVKFIYKTEGIEKEK